MHSATETPVGAKAPAAQAAPCPSVARNRHRFAYRASSSIFGRRFYLAVFFGAEKRDPSRLKDERQRKTFVGLIVTVLGFVWIMFFVTVLLLGLGVVAAYLLKSSLGINLFEQHSFLHDYFYD